MKELLFFEPVVRDLIWGREVWTICAHSHGTCRVREGRFEGVSLAELWNQHRELFGYVDCRIFPILVKRIEAWEDLSIQVHPDNEYAAKYENGELGKTECWYVLNCKPDGTIIIGHHAKNREEAAQMIKENRWDEFLREVPIKKGDFLRIDPGTIHAIKHDTEILEIQQSSDITYRLYDYERLVNGQVRELHIDKSIDVMTVPFPQADLSQDCDAQHIKCEYFTITKHEVNNRLEMEQSNVFQIISVVKGAGMIDEHEIQTGESFIIPYQYGKYCLTGNMSILVTEL
ncbi:MAG: class I mannose-6-phosphate isomerase [Clostridia bacterium]|nr:class I mannose-6-phosphate isomerase [Clostridia bacterium]